ncbi:sporulation protein YabP [Desulfoscipio geothermicus]|uniref:Sporulation protein YabP n=1 Tax=Desulfoscipio geothermicus DSM 3669 TaxID=1121426 RepID=A0A1I6DGF8_9FIRM|nr:sporulation protein YabP [Desulfoscipio geothermicus]SFR04471.1 sporulation protein YabP [Desulfoscipio geothermicus DSM 3669]
MEQKQAFSNRLVLTDRRYLQVDGVEHVGNFNEKEITLDTNMGFLTLRGEGLHITQLNLESGNLVVEGKINFMEFTDGKGSGGFRGKGMLNRIFK